MDLSRLFVSFARLDFGGTFSTAVSFPLVSELATPTLGVASEDEAEPFFFLLVDFAAFFVFCCSFAGSWGGGGGVALPVGVVWAWHAARREAWWEVTSRASFQLLPVCPGGVNKRRRPEDVSAVSTHLQNKRKQ